MKIAGFVLIAIGIIALAYGGFTYTSHKKELDMGPVQVEKTEHHSVPVPPVLGVVSILLGGVLIYGSARGSSV